MSQRFIDTSARTYPFVPRRLRIPIIGLVVLAALLVAVVIGPSVLMSLANLSSNVQALVTVFLGIFIEALPFLLAGVITSSAIHLFVSPERIQRLSPRAPLVAALAGALLGLAFPVCECGSIPAARRLLEKGAPLPLGIAFVLAAPVINPIVIISTAVAFAGRPEIVIGRIGLTVLIAVAVGLILGLHPRPDELLAPQARPHSHTPGCAHTHAEPDQTEATEQKRHGASRFRSAIHSLRAMLHHASDEFFEMVRYLVIGGLIAATLQVLIPRAALLELGQGPVVSALVLMALAVLMSICSTVDAFVALAFASSFLPGALLAFLVFGPMIDIKSIFMLNSTFQRRTVAFIVLLTFQMVLLAAVVINIYVV